MKAHRNVVCILCNYALPVGKAVPCGLGRYGQVPTWAHKSCISNPEGARRRRQEAQAKREAKARK